MTFLSKLGGSTGGDPAADSADPPDGAGTARVEIDSATFEIADLKVRSFRIPKYDGGLIARQHFTFVLHFEAGGEEVAFSGRGVVIRLDRRTGLVARFFAPQPYYDGRLVDYLMERRGVRPRRRRSDDAGEGDGGEGDGGADGGDGTDAAAVR